MALNLRSIGAASALMLIPEAASEAVDYFYKFFSERLDTCELQRFDFTDTVTHTDFPNLTNVIARYHTGMLPRVALCAHWDSRPRAEHDPDSTKRNTPIPGANDGASGCAVLMELANILPHIDCPYGVDIVLFDGEDYGESGNLDYYCLGSKRYVADLPHDYYAFAILLDMVGDSDLRIYRERYSQTYARRIVDMVWQKAAELGVSAFVDSLKHTVYDDHLAFLNVGIPAIDIIDFDYPYWHTQEDTPDKCSPASLADVGKVLVALLSR
jgi:glutaminyl-peptide cyclotransferase